MLMLLKKKHVTGNSQVTGNLSSNFSGNQSMMISRGFLFAVGSTLLTCFLLFINGGLVSAICNAAILANLAGMQTAGVHQFLLFVGPVFLVVIQWMMIDYVTSRLRR